jgi:hypothetical protein
MSSVLDQIDKFAKARKSIAQKYAEECYSTLVDEAVNIITMYLGDCFKGKALESLFFLAVNSVISEFIIEFIRHTKLGVVDMVGIIGSIFNRKSELEEFINECIKMAEMKGGSEE